MKRMWLAAALLASCCAALADETASRIRTAVAHCEKSIFTLRAVISVEMQGRTVEGKVEVPVTTLDASGLLVAPDPEAMVGGMGQSNVTTKGFQLVTADGKEFEAKVKGRDKDFSLIFLQLTSKEALGAPPAARAKPCELGDEILVVRKHSASHPDALCEMARVSCVVQKPRLMYLLSENGGPGCLALSAEGELIGLTVVVREQDPDTGRATPMLVVLPIAQVVEAAKGIHEEEPKPKEEVPQEKKEEAPKEKDSPPPTAP